MRTEVVADDALDALFPDAYASIIEIRTRGRPHAWSGATTSRAAIPRRRSARQELAKKFRKLAGSVAAPERVAALEGALATLPEAREIDTLAALLGARPDASDPPPP